MDSVNVNNLLVVSDMPCHYRLSFLNNDYVTLFFYFCFCFFFASPWKVNMEACAKLVFYHIRSLC
jgi:hypothetical protein